MNTETTGGLVQNVFATMTPMKMKFAIIVERKKALRRIKSVLKYISEGGQLTPEVVEECKRAYTLLQGKMLDIPCVDCNEVVVEYYMVTNHVWHKEAGFQTNKGIICIDCLEKRIGRELKRDDFTDCPLNKTVRRMMK